MDELIVARYPEMESKHFWWAVRRGMVRELVGDVTAELPLTILDVGCGSGLTGEMLTSLGAKVVGVDIQRQRDEMRIEFVEGDYLSVSDRLGSFDVVLALDAIEHFESETEVVSAIAANLRPGGHLVVTVPAYRFLWSSHDVAHHHYRRYTKGSLLRALTAAGLDVKRAGYVFMGLALPKAILALLERITHRQAPTGTGIDGLANRLASRYFGAETRVAMTRAGFLPFGTSVVAVAEKPSTN